MKTNVSDTSRMAFRKLKATGKIEREKQFVLRVMETLGPCTSRMLMNMSGLERGNITRCLFDLENADRIEVVFKDKCVTTKMTVNHYRTKKGDSEI